MTERLVLEFTLRELEERAGGDIVDSELMRESLPRLCQDGRLVADSFYTSGFWEIGLKRACSSAGADLIVVIHPLKESAGIYLEKWPVMSTIGLVTGW